MIRPLVSLEQFAFYLQHSPGVGPATMRSILARLEKQDLTFQEFLDLDEDILRTKFGLKPEGLSAIRNPSSSILSLWNSLENSEVSIRVLGSKSYPQKLLSVLGKTAPPILYFLGNEKLLGIPSVGFCGSRKASPVGIDVAERCGAILSEESIAVVSGYAAGVDMATHIGAVRAGGSTIIVLPNGISHFSLKAEILALLKDVDLSSILVVSEFPPKLPWKAHNAMTRNRTIVGLSDAMVVIESGLTGGTFEAGNVAISLKVPLFCIEYAVPPSTAPGNAYFLNRGAIAIRRGSNGLPNLGKILDSISNTSERRKIVEFQPDLLFSEKSDV